MLDRERSDILHAYIHISGYLTLKNGFFFTSKDIIKILFSLNWKYLKIGILVLKQKQIIVL